MNIKERIDAFIAKKSKASLILELMMNKEYVTCSDIINFGCENTPLVFTTSPHKLIETIRKTFGADFVKDDEIKFSRTFYKNGKPYKLSDTYKRYFLDKIGMIEGV